MKKHIRKFHPAMIHEVGYTVEEFMEETNPMSHKIVDVLNGLERTMEKITSDEGLIGVHRKKELSFYQEAKNIIAMIIGRIPTLEFAKQLEARPFPQRL